MARDLVIIGVSAGGLDAVCSILRDLPATIAFALVVVQHRSKDSYALCEVLERCADVPVHEAADKDDIEIGHVYLAPADYHLLIDEGAVALSVDAPEFYSRPSIDLTFESVADFYGERAIGVVLTGANSDGAKGLRRIVDRGGLGIVQEPSTAEVATMPKAALKAVPEAEVLPLSQIASRLVTLTSPAPAAARRKNP